MNLARSALVKDGMCKLVRDSSHADVLQQVKKACTDGVG